MKSLYITSVERYSGKTATCLALGKHLQADGYRVGYLKPLSLQPWRIGDQIADEDAAFVKEVLGLDAQPWELSPVIVTAEFLRSHAGGETRDDLMQRVKQACESAGRGKDVLLLEGGGSLREGYVVDLPTVAVANAIGSNVLAVVKYRDEVRVIDDALAAHNRLADKLSGVIINRVPGDAARFVADVAAPFLEKRGIAVLGVLPEVKALAALSVGEIADVLHAEALTETIDREAQVETLTVGAMTADIALSRFRKQQNKAVITGGDRTDIQLAALETSTTCLILTGNLRPRPLIVKQAEDLGVTVLLVGSNTIDTVEALERVFGKTRLGQPAKLAQFESLLAEHVDMRKLYDAVGLEK